MHGSTRLAFLVIATAALATGACRRKPAAAPTPVVNQDSIDAANARQDSIARADQMRRDSIARSQSQVDNERAERDRLDRMMSEARTTLTNPVYFEFDRSDLTPEDIARLDAKIPLLNANPALRIRVAGHTDSRGSDEYNLALGQRRAAAAKRYLAQHGIAANRIETVSFGEERPASTGTDDSALAENRRAEFEIIAGGETLTLPSGQ